MAAKRKAAAQKWGWKDDRDHLFAVGAVKGALIDLPVFVDLVDERGLTKAQRTKLSRGLSTISEILRNAAERVADEARWEPSRS
jgi:hypothetical protein